MIIDPGFADHWKVRELNRLSQSKEGIYWLLRLWGEVQRRHSQQFGGEVAELAAICQHDGDPAVFCEWLVKLRFLEMRKSGYWVRSWEEYNATLIANWENGQKGGRPKKTQSKPKETHGITQSENGLTQNAIGLTEEIRGEERRIEEKTTLAKESHSKQQTKEQMSLLPAAPEKNKSKPSDWKEFAEYVITKQGLKTEDARYLWDHWKTNGHKNGGKPILDWKALVRSWKHAGYFPSQKNQNR